MTGDFLDRLNRAAYRAWVARWQAHGADPDAMRIYDPALAGARRFIDGLPTRARAVISSPVHPQNVRPA